MVLFALLLEVIQFLSKGLPYYLETSVEIYWYENAYVFMKDPSSSREKKMITHQI